MRSSKHLKRRAKTNRSRLIANMESAARRLQRYAVLAECEIGEIGTGTALRAFASGLREVADMLGERRMTLRSNRRRKVNP
jgi:hypothetical protein